MNTKVDKTSQTKTKQAEGKMKLLSFIDLYTENGREGISNELKKHVHPTTHRQCIADPKLRLIGQFIDAVVVVAQTPVKDAVGLYLATVGISCVV